MLAKMVAVIGVEENDRVRRHAGAVEGREYRAHVLVHVRHTGVVSVVCVRARVRPRVRACVRVNVCVRVRVRALCVRAHVCVFDKDSLTRDADHAEPSQAQR